MTSFPGWRTMTGVQRRNAKMDAMFERARAQGHTTFNAASDEAAKRPELTYDGKGINGPDEYRERVATFHHCSGDEYGPLFAASPDLLAACREVAETFAATLPGRYAWLDKVRAAIAKATKPGVSDD